VRNLMITKATPLSKCITCVPLLHLFHSSSSSSFNYYTVSDSDNTDNTNRGLGPGAGSLLKKLTDPSLPPEKQIDVKKTPRELSTEEWRNLVRVFEDWPFRPEVS
jgi:hypothetical protein